MTSGPVSLPTRPRSRPLAPVDTHEPASWPAAGSVSRRCCPTTQPSSCVGSCGLMRSVRRQWLVVLSTNPCLEGKLVQQSGHPAELHDVSHLSRPVAVDLFCGAGGLSSGLERAGFDVALGLDFNRHVVDTYRANHGGVMVHADVRDVNGGD